MTASRILVSAESLAEKTALTLQEISILTKHGVFTRKYDIATSSVKFNLDEALAAVNAFDRLIVTRDGLDPDLHFKISYPEFNALYPGESEIKPIGQDWLSGRALFRFSDVLAWRKEHRNCPAKNELPAVKSLADTPAPAEKNIPAMTESFRELELDFSDNAPLVTINDIAEFSGFSRQYIQRLITNGRFIQPFRKSRPMKFRRSEVVKFLHRWTNKFINKIDLSRFLQGNMNLALPHLLSLYNFPKPDPNDLWLMSDVLKWKVEHPDYRTIVKKCELLGLEEK